MKINLLLTFGILSSIDSFYNVQASQILAEKQSNKAVQVSTQPQEGREYVTLANPLTTQPKVVEFFSFYCGPCYQFIINLPCNRSY